MDNRKNILVVVDPSRETQPAFDRMVWMAGNRGPQNKIILFIAPDYELLGKGHEAKNLCRGRKWISSLTDQLDAKGIEHEIYYSWETEWAASILELVAEHDVGMLLVPVYLDKSEGNLLSDEMWSLLRSAHIQILFIRDDVVTKPRKKILGCIKIQDETVKELNARVVDQLKFVAGANDAEIYIANAYESSTDYPDRARLIELAGVPNDRLFIEQKSLDELIESTKAKFDADLLVIGIRSRRKTAKELLRGKSIERILKAADCDLMAVP